MAYAPATMEAEGIGDAVGAPFEQPGSATEPPARLEGWDGSFLDTHGLYGNFKAGEWTDDTGMAAALAESLLENRMLLAETTMRHYLQWYKEVPNQLVGGTIKKAMENFRNGDSATECGILNSQGNGTAMRCAPIGLFFWRDFEMAMGVARWDASFTHRSLEAEEGSAAVAGMVALLVSTRLESGLNFEDYPWPLVTLMSSLTHSLRPSMLKNALCSLPTAAPTKPEVLAEVLRQIGTKGHVLQTVPAAFACLLLTSSFEEAVLAAVRAGGDADTTAAIAGAMAGALYGRDGIPERWRTGVHRGDYLRKLDDRLFHEAYQPGSS